MAELKEEDITLVIEPPKPLKDGELVNYNMEYYKRRGIDKVDQIIRFDNVSELVDCCTHNLEQKHWDNKGYRFDNNSSWTFGKDFPDLKSTHRALMDGIIPIPLIEQVDKIKLSLYEKHPELFDIEASATKLKRRRLFSEYGDELDIDKYLNGDVEMWQRMTRRPVKQCIKIMINSCLHCGHESKEFQEGIIMVTSFLDILDKAGIASEVYYAPVSKNSSQEVCLDAVLCRIKSAEEPLDICKMLSCGAAGLFRYYCFRIWTNLLKGKPGWGLGSMVTDKSELEIMKKLGGFDVMINANDSAQTTFNIITSYIKELF